MEITLAPSSIAEFPSNLWTQFTLSWFKESFFQQAAHEYCRSDKKLIIGLEKRMKRQSAKMPPYFFTAARITVVYVPLNITEEWQLAVIYQSPIVTTSLELLDTVRLIVL